MGKLVSQRQDKGDFDRPPGCPPRRTAHAVLLAVVVFVVLELLAPWLPIRTTAEAAVAVSAHRMALTTSAAGTAGNAATPPAVPAGSVPVVADPAGILSFERVEVETIAADGTRERTVASRGLARPSAGMLLAPLEVLKPSSPFGTRINPLSGAAGEFHYGQDFAARCGTRVYSSDAGVARAVGWHAWGGGNRVEIDHGNGIITTYNHLESSAVKQGESVKVGEVIARVGTTGSSTGCHLHFETIAKGVHANPLNWTLVPVSQVDRLDELPELSFEPGSGIQADRAPVWAVPVKDASKRSVTGGENEAPVPKPTDSSSPGPGDTPPGPGEPPGRGHSARSGGLRPVRGTLRPVRGTLRPVRGTLRPVRWGLPGGVAVTPPVGPGGAPRSIRWILRLVPGGYSAWSGGNSGPVGPPVVR